MAQNRRPSWRVIKSHRNYTVEDVSLALKVSKGTVRRWIKGDLPAITDRKPALLLGGDLVDFLKARARPKSPCGPGEFYCFKCRAPRKPAQGMLEIISKTMASANVRAICIECETLMHRRVSHRKIQAFGASLGVSFAQPSARLEDSADTSVNDHLQRSVETHA